jgi:TetR/AcrR family transcriptional regulator
MAKPVTPDPSAREAILAAATELFAAQGFAGVTIKEIASKAKVNSALLYYYFDDKEGLYREALAQMIGSVSQRIGGAITSPPPSTPLSPEEGVRKFVLAQAERFFENKNFGRLVLRELFDAGTVRLETPMHAVVTNALRPLMELIKAGQRSGTFRADVDPRFAVISTVAQVAYFTLAQPIVAELMDRPGPVPVETARAYGVHAADFVIRALKA